MGRTEQELAILITGKDVSATRAVKGVNRELNEMGRIAGKAGRNTARNLERTIVAGAAAAAGAIGYSVKKAGDFEAGMQLINTVALATPQVLAKASDGIRSIARATGVGLEDLQAAEYDLVSAGVKLQDANDGLLASVKLGRGAYGTTAEAVDVLTTAVNAYNLKAADGTVSTAAWARVSDELAQAVADGKVKISEIAASYADVAPVAAQYKVATAEIAASYGLLTSKGVPAAEVTTQMQRAILSVVAPGKTMGKVLKAIGSSGADLIAKKGLGGALEIIRKKAGELGIAFDNDLFGRVEGFKYALQTTGPNAAAFATELDKVNHSAGMTGKQFDVRSQGLNYQLARLKANVDDAAITIGSELLPIIGDLAAQGTDWLGGHQAEIKAFAQDLAAGIRDAVEWGKQLDWDAIAAALRSGADAAKTIVETFLGLPAPIQQLLAGGFVANKVTGGAVMDLVGLGTRLALRQMNVTAGVVNVSGGVGGAGGVGGVAGGKGGLGKSLLRAAGAGIGIGVMGSSNAANGNGSLNEGGFFGNIGGGALAGGSIAGPLGALAGGVLGVAKSVTELESTMNTNLARQAHNNLGSLQGVGTSDLLTKLSAIDTGINQINSNPLNVLVSGDALSELQQMREQVVAALEANQAASTANLQPLPESITKKQAAKFDALRDKIEANRIATVSKTESVRAATVNSQAAIVGAIRALNLSPTINIPITLRNGQVVYGSSPTGQTLVRVGSSSGASGGGAARGM